MIVLAVFFGTWVILEVVMLVANFRMDAAALDSRKPTPDDGFLDCAGCRLRSFPTQSPGRPHDIEPQA